ncbi:single-stranded DNA-binding protein [Bifidobacterium sp.]|uniref:single-stranded DNA-binding protein n=1 Tax=Bifidobacterium sp. TaxID=41200 RepID=UPI0025BE37B6|nr:single-stranded DNA-binding protein [Bifidobacterium sp.]MCH4209657.1 single-stranded DNA-binding protein [Bifidobacterium sp.]MCI1225106.1 single-stranded DNA-binding protein [Bifidobacterium sp.]
MAQQGTITITGFVGADPISFGREGGPGACSFRVGSTRSSFHAASGEWKEHPTTWITIKAFRALAVNILASVRKGDPVIVTGLLNTEEWQQDGNNRSRIVIEASAVGHDLTRGVDTFQRQISRRAQSPGQLPGQTTNQQHAGQREQSAEPGYARPPSNGTYASPQSYGGSGSANGQRSYEQAEGVGNPGIDQSFAAGGSQRSENQGSEKRSSGNQNGEETAGNDGNMNAAVGEDPWNAGPDNVKAGESRNVEEFAGSEF